MLPRNGYNKTEIDKPYSNRSIMSRAHQQRRRGRNAISSLTLLYLTCTITINLQQIMQPRRVSSIFVDAAPTPCTTASECQETLGLANSFCMNNGYCGNPFHNKGCLANLLPTSNNTNNSSAVSSKSKEYIRVCSSVDPSEAEKLGYCRPPADWNYTEIRFMGNNWEAVFFETWIVQIVLSEILGVPTTVDTGVSDKVVDFYDISGRMEYGKSFDWDAMRTANQVKDCREVQQKNNNSDEYTSCAHVSLEVWEGQKENLYKLQKESVIEKPMAMGVIAYGGWYVPKFTGQRDPTLLNYLGLMGEENRRKLAAAFLRPTKWIDYCTLISSTNCSIPDNVAQRPPADETENARMFVEGLYTGYFRNTTQNDCITNPTTCTGHIADYPCGWSSFIYQQIYHLNIALTSDGDEPYAHGYTYSQMIEIWAAANATKSNCLLPWWTPEPLFQQYVGTDAEFQRVNLPVPTEQCVTHRVNSADRCTANMTNRIGSALGACDEQPQALTKVVTKSFYDICYGGNTVASLQEAMYNPAYETVRNFEVANLEIGVMFDNWLEKKLDKWQFDPRLAVCEWVVDNFDTIINTFIPKQYPRVMVDTDDTHGDPLFYISLIVAILVLLYVVAISAVSYKLRHRRVMVLAQVEFLFLLLFGLILIQLGSLTLAVPPSNGSCILATWLINLGYTMELVPLIVKIAAINKLMAAARNMRRVKIQRSNLLAVVAFLVTFIALFLMIWTILDPRQKGNHYILTDELNEYNETIVRVESYCRSDDLFWSIIALAWRSILLLCATILAFQTRNCPVNVNESKTLGIMIYSQFIFVVWTLILFIMAEQSEIIIKSNIARYQSLIESADVCAVCCIYFVPKLCTTDDIFNKLRRSSNTTGIPVSIHQDHQSQHNPEANYASTPSNATPNSHVDGGDGPEETHRCLSIMPEALTKNTLDNDTNQELGDRKTVAFLIDPVHGQEINKEKNINTHSSDADLDEED